MSRRGVQEVLLLTPPRLVGRSATTGSGDREEPRVPSVNVPTSVSRSFLLRPRQTSQARVSTS
jgi:hypothetical protein